jgi:protoporphyrinogen/coproporphyrinogen III oxidase
LVGGISAGAIDQLSADAMAPQLAAVRDRRSVLLALARSPRPADGPVFFTLRSGIGHLANTLADRLGPAIRTSTPIDAIEPIDGGWSLVSGQTITSVDRVVIATPPHCAASAIGPVAPEAAGLLASITSASVAMVTLVVSRSALDRTDSSGFLVPRGERRLVTACSWGTAKWPHWTGADDQFVLRASVGSVDDPSPLNLDDDVLVNAVLDDLHRTMGLTAAPNGVRVTRWPLAFPQYRPGHLDLVASIRRSLPEGMRIAGSAVDGVGIPACIRSGRAAAFA